MRMTSKLIPYLAWGARAIRQRLGRQNFHEMVRAEHFQRLSDPAQARQLFKRSVTNVEIETSSYCNRVCRFCPNSFIDRRSRHDHMSERIYGAILADLASIDFDGEISYSRYNEPLAERTILDRLRQARHALPKARLASHTNGDYLDRPYLDDLHDAGLDALHIQIYPVGGEAVEPDTALRRMADTAQKLGLPLIRRATQPGVLMQGRFLYKRMDITITARNFDVSGCRRGNLVDAGGRFQRLSPCPVVFGSLYVDWTGAVVPCCNIRSDAPEHESYVIGTVGRESGIFSLFADSDLVDWRRHLAGWGEKAAPCDQCRFALVPDTAANRRAACQVGSAC